MVFVQCTLKLVFAIRYGTSCAFTGFCMVLSGAKVDRVLSAFLLLRTFWTLPTRLFTWIVMMTLCSGQPVVWDSSAFSTVLSLRSMGTSTLKFISPLVILLWMTPITQPAYSLSSRSTTQTLSRRACP